MCRGSHLAFLYYNDNLALYFNKFDNLIYAFYKNSHNFAESEPASDA